MGSSIETLGPTKREIRVTIPAAHIDGKADERLRSIAKTARIRGFRKGKTPMSVVRRLFEREVYAELTTSLVYEAFQSAVEEHDLSLAGDPSFDKLDQLAARGQDLTFAVTCEVWPEIESLSFEGVAVTKRLPPQDVGVFVARRLQQYRDAQARVEELAEPRPAQAGDWLRIRVAPASGSEADGAVEPKEDTIVLTPEHVSAAFVEALSGHSVGDAVTVDNVGVITIEEIRQRVLPDLDDEFAKDNDFESLAAMKEHIASEFRSWWEKEDLGFQERAFWKQLVAANPIDVPESLVEKVAADMLKRGSGDGEDAEPDEEAREAARAEALEQVRQHALQRHLQKTENIEVEREELDGQVKDMAQQLGLPVDLVRSMVLRDEHSRFQLYDKIIAQKCYAAVADKVSVEEQPTGWSSKEERDALVREYPNAALRALVMAEMENEEASATAGAQTDDGGDDA